MHGENLNHFTPCRLWRFVCSSDICYHEFMSSVVLVLGGCAANQVVISLFSVPHHLYVGCKSVHVREVRNPEATGAESVIPVDLGVMMRCQWVHDCLLQCLMSATVLNMEQTA